MHCQCTEHFLKNRVSIMKYIETVDGSELHIREGVLHVMGKRRHIAKDIWLIVGDDAQVETEYYETKKPDRLGFTKFLVIPRNDKQLIEIIEEVGLENASQSGKQQLIIVEK